MGNGCEPGCIAAIEADIPRDATSETLDVSGKLILPGIIDTHAHVYQYVIRPRCARSQAMPWSLWAF